MATGFGVVLVLVALAYLLHWRGWGKGKWNLGPRIAALAVISAGIPFAATVGAWVQATSNGIGVFLINVLAGFGHPEVNPLIKAAATEGPWIIGVFLLIVWLLALLPGVSEAMTWGLAWSGFFLAGLLTLAPMALRAPGTTIVMGIGGAVQQFAAGLMHSRGA